jgi:FkbM family methyltransferase
VAACYRLILGREPDERGYEVYVNLVRDASISVDQLVRFFLVSPEFRDRLHRVFGWADSPLEPVDLKLGYRIFVRANDSFVGASVKTNREYEPHVSSELSACLHPGDVFVDVGASLGYYTTMAGRIVGPSGRVIACEPGPQNWSVLLLNVISNDLHNVELHHLAVSDSSGAVLYSQAGGNGAITPFDGDIGSLAVHDLVEAQPLDTILRSAHRVDVIKVDVEGAEGLVLAGAAETLKSYRPILFFEFSPPALLAVSRMDAKTILMSLESLGYRFTVLGEPGRKLSLASVLEAFDRSKVDHIDVLAEPLEEW